MRPYTTDDAASFHGRDREIGELLGRLRAGEREIYVIDPSGSGKSSLVMAVFCRGSQDSVMSAAFSPDGMRVLTAHAWSPFLDIGNVWERKLTN